MMVSRRLERAAAPAQPARLFAVARTAALFGFMGLVAALPGCGGSADATLPTFDITDNIDSEPREYVAKVDQLTVLSLAVAADHGGALRVGHPVELKAEIEVQAEPFQAVLWFGLQTADGKHCAIDHVATEHLAEMFEAAERANIAASDTAISPPQPSLTDCSADHKCAAAGETCVAFQEQTDDTAVAAGSPDFDPSTYVPPTAGTPAPTNVTVKTVTSYLCATQDYGAARVQKAHAAAAVVTPATLAGSVKQRHIVGAISELPAECATLVGASDVTAWVAFDPEGETLFGARPDVGDAGVGAPATVLDQDHEVAFTEENSFNQRLAFSTPVAVAADTGLDVDLHHIETGSSVISLRMDDNPGGDLHVEAEYSLDGTPSTAQSAALAGATLKFHFTVQPVGTPRDGCMVPVPAPSTAEVPVMVVHDNNGAPVDVSEEPAPNLALGRELEKSFPLYLNADVKAAIFGDWSCWDQFAIKACLTTTIPQSMDDAADDCATVDVNILRDVPPDGATIETEPMPPHYPPPIYLGNSGCDDKLFAEYANNTKNYQMLEDQVLITDYYTYDFGGWVWGTFTPGEEGEENKYVNSAVRQKAYAERTLWHLAECEKSGGVGCQNLESFRFDPYGLDVDQWKTKVIPYFWDPYGNTSPPQHYKAFRADPQAFTRTQFDYECAGIQSGSVCSEINYDLTRVPELARRMRDTLSSFRRGDALNDKMSTNGRTRCITRGYPPLRRANLDPKTGKLTLVPDDGAFFTDYLTQVCNKGRFKAAADAAWNKIMSSCTYVARPFSDSASGVRAGRFMPDLYRVYSTGYKSGLEGVAEGGIVNDYIVFSQTGQFKLIFGAQGRVYVRTEPGSVVSGWLDVYDIFSASVLANLYDDVVSSYVEAGFHALTLDIWKISYKLPKGTFTLPNPPKLSKEKEKCKYLWKPPMPFRIELCGAVGGELAINVSATIGKSGVTGVDPNKTDWPGASGTVTPSVSITTAGRAGIDVLLVSAGLVVSINPTLGVSIPVTIGAKWNLKMPNKKTMDWVFAPFVDVKLALNALGGEVALYVRWKTGTAKEQQVKLFEWDPLKLAEWTLYKQNWDASNTIRFP